MHHFSGKEYLSSEGNSIRTLFNIGKENMQSPVGKKKTENSNSKLREIDMTGTGGMGLMRNACRRLNLSERQQVLVGLSMLFLQ